MKQNHLFNSLLSTLQARVAGSLLMALLCVSSVMAQEAYVALDQTKTELSFYYDDSRSVAESRGSTTYDLNTGTDTPAWLTDANKASVTSVWFERSFRDYRPTSTHMWFFEMSNLKQIYGLKNLNTSEVTRMGLMFSGCSSLEKLSDDHTGVTLDLGSFDTGKVTSMSYMFSDCTSLQFLDLSSFNTSNVHSMTGMFQNCSKLTTIYVGNGWDTSNASTSNSVFEGCTKLKGGNGTGYSKNYTGMTYARIDASGTKGYLTKAPATEAYVNQDGNTNYFFYDSHRASREGKCYNIDRRLWGGSNKYIIDPSFASYRPTSTRFWFEGCSCIEGLEYLKTDRVTDMSYMFVASSFSHLDLSSLNTEKVTNMEGMFQECEKLVGLNLHSFNTANVTNMDEMFFRCRKLQSVNLSSFTTANVKDMSSMFAECGNLTSLDLSSFNTSNVTNMQYVFYGDSLLTTIVVGDGWTTSNVTKSGEMFKNCVSLVGGNGTKYNSTHTDKGYARLDAAGTPGYLSSTMGTQDYAVFNNGTLTFYHDNLSNKRNGMVFSLTRYDDGRGQMRAWESVAEDVTTVNFEASFADARPTDISLWFYGMKNLAAINGIENLNTSEVTDMSLMFYDCSSLTMLDLTHFNTSKVNSMSYMFYGCSSLTTIYVAEGWTSKGYGNAMFEGCTSLVGGVGTTYDAQHIDYEYARIDAVDAPGYLTLLPYAVLQDGTMTFYYDLKRASREGTVYDVKPDLAKPDWTDSQAGNVTKVVFDASFVAARPTNTGFWFAQMTNLEEISGLDYLNTSRVTNMAAMFGTCSSLLELDLSAFNTANVTNMSGMFAACTKLNAIYVSEEWNTSKVTNASMMFYDCKALRGQNGTTVTTSNQSDIAYAQIDGAGYLPGLLSTPAYAVLDGTMLVFYRDLKRNQQKGKTYSLNTGTNTPGWVLDGSNEIVTHVTFYPTFSSVRPTSGYQWFMGMSNLKKIDIECLNTSAMTYMSEMFLGCVNLESLDVSRFNTSKVKSMYRMFANCTKVKNLNLRSFDTSAIFDMGQLQSMFEGCRSLTSLDLTSFNTTNVEDMSRMFWDCTSLTTICVTNYDFSTSKVTNSEGMFHNCTSLRGGNGTVFTADHTDKLYARLDGGTSRPGYFSEAPYAVYNNGTLTFYMDNARNSRTGTVCTLEYNYGWDWRDHYKDITKVVFDASFAKARPTSTRGWFSGLTNLTSIVGMKEYLNTSNVTDMSSMFSGCQSLEAIDVSGFNTENVTNMANMFNCGGQTSLKTLDVSGFNTEKVTDMSYMFYGCMLLETLDVSGFNTAKVTDMSYMFNYCRKVAALDVSGFNTANVTNMAYMFGGCWKVPTLDVSGFNTENVTNMEGMFNYCQELTTLALDGFNTKKVTSMSYMFQRCTKLTTICVGDDWSTEAVTSSTNMFDSSTLLVGGNGTVYDASHKDKEYARIDAAGAPGYFTGPSAYAVYYAYTLTFYYDGMKALRKGIKYDLPKNNTCPWYNYRNDLKKAVFDKSFAKARPTTTACWFQYMGQLAEIENLENLNTSEVTTMASMFAGCRNLKTLDLRTFETGQVTNMEGMFGGCSGLTAVDVSTFNTENVTDMNTMFSSCSNLTELDLSGFNTSQVTSMSTMFYDCSKLTAVDMSKFNTERVTDMSNMFNGCNSLESLDLSTFNTSKVESMAAMFQYCGSLTSLDLSTFNTEKVTDMDNMFAFCYSLESLSLDGFNASEVVQMENMFNSCFALTSLDLSAFNTEKVANMNYMFADCGSLTTIDLSTFNTENVWSMTELFARCFELKTIYAGDGWSTENVMMTGQVWDEGAGEYVDVTPSTYNIFEDCFDLVGGNGTTYNSMSKGLDYAVIDGKDGKRGYFTDISAFMIGDVNEDGSITIADVTALVNIILGKSAAGSYNATVADVNQDGSITIADVTALVNIILEK